MWSCSNDDNISSEPQVINQQDEPTVRTLDRFSEIEPSFASFLMQSETRSTDDDAGKADTTAISPSKSEWDDEVYEFKDNEGLTAQMVAGKYMDNTTVACVYYVKNENVEVEPTILLMQQVSGNEFILCAENDTPLMRVVQVDDNNIEYALLTDQKVVQRYLCRITMATAGNTISQIINRFDRRAAIYFNIVWSIITENVCK